MKILIDGDGVVFNMLEAIESREPMFCPSGVVDYGFKTESYGISRQEVFKYLSDLETFKRQKLYRGAKEGVRQLCSMGSVYGFTDVPDYVKDFRRHQFKKLGINKVFIVSDKVHNLEDCDVLIEDSLDVVRAYPDSTIRFLIDRPYNRCSDDYGIIRVKNLIEVARVLKKIKESLKSY